MFAFAFNPADCESEKTAVEDESFSLFRVPQLMSFPSLGDSYMNSIMKLKEFLHEEDNGAETSDCESDRERELEKEIRRETPVGQDRCDHEKEEEAAPSVDANDGPALMSLLSDSEYIHASAPPNYHRRSVDPLTPSLSQFNSYDESDSSQKSEDSFSSFAQLEVSSSQEVPSRKILPEHVRWFYKPENEKKWTPFTGFDSLRIEIKYRELNNFDVASYESSLKSLSKLEVDTLRSCEKIVVRGGVYEVDIPSRLCASIFWAGDSSAITRGVWFYDGSWQPIEECFSEEIEEEHLKTFQNYNTPLSEPDSPKKSVTHVLHHVQFADFHVEWYGVTDVYLYSEAKSSKIMRSVTVRLGFQKSGYKLQRGYYGDATPTDRQPDITHLVFVIHGIGQKIDTQRIIRNCGSLRKCANWLKDNDFCPSIANDERSEFFPVEWRSSLKLDGDTVDSITLHRVRGLREFLNCSAMDILYYTSPLYRAELIKGLQVELNRLYTLFCERNPYFESKGGKVSIVAHSLGCVITYDIITGWNPRHLYESYVANDPELLVEEQEGTSDEERILLRRLSAARQEVSALEEEVRALRQRQSSASPREHELLFSIENFFCLGSPLAVFLALRGVRPSANGTQNDILPTSLVKRIFNIYHPADPVAYRLEPLVLKHYSSIMPVNMHYYGTAGKIPYELMKPEPMPSETQDKRPQSPLSDDCFDSNAGSPSRSVKAPSESRWSMVWTNWVRRRDNALPSTELKEIKSDSSDCDEAFCPNEHSGKASNLTSTELAIDTEFASMELEDVLIRSPSSKALEPLGRMSPASSGSCSQSEPLQSPKTPELSELDNRLDYMLREGNLENSYISALTSHTSYWTSYDVAHFILTYLHPSPAPEQSMELGSTASPSHTAK